MSDMRKHGWTYYKNGNYYVFLNLDTGTKHRITPKSSFVADFPESMDIKITNQCDMGCAFCHEDSKPDGRHANLEGRWVDSLQRGQEIAIGGGNVLSHPKFVKFLELLQKKGCVASITLNQVHFLGSFDFVKSLYEKGLVYGIGVSLTNPTGELIEKLQEIPTTVLHTICGILDEDAVSLLANNDLRLLILGYKNFRRGQTFLNEHEAKIQENIDWLSQNINIVFDSFEVTSFDNLALEQLELKNKVSAKVWSEHYMGDEGSHTFYIDAVNEEYALTSACPERFPIANMTVDEMFKDIRNRY